MDFETKDSGSKREFSTGCVRDAAEGKGSFVSIPHGPMKRLAQLMERGAKRYGTFNFRKGMPLSVAYDSALRHLFQAKEGFADEDHKAAVLFNVIVAMFVEDEIAAGRLPAELDDMPRPPDTANTEITHYGIKCRVVDAVRGIVEVTGTLPTTDCPASARNYCA